MMPPLKRLLTSVARYKTMLGLGMVCLVVANLFKAAVPIAVQQSVDNLSQGITHSLLFRYVATIIALGLLQGGFAFAQERLLLGTARCIERDLKSSFYAHLQKLPFEFFQEHRTGELMALASNDIAGAINASTHAFMYSLNTAVLLAIILPLMARLSWKLTLLASAPLLLVMIATLVLQKPMRARFEKVQESFGRICARAQEALWAARTVRAYTQETAEIEAFRHVSWRYVSDNVRRARLSSLLYPLLQFFIGFSFIAVLWYGGDLTAGRNLSIGQFFEFILYLGYLAWPMHILGWELTVLQRGMVSMARVESVLSLRPAIQDSAIPVAVGEIRGSLEFRNVTFRYKGADRPAIDGISFQINPGETVGLVGAVGSGKSTLMNLVPRLLEPCSGDILMDGHSVRQIPLKVLRSSLGYVPQETFLFSDTIAANIAFGNGRASQKEIEQAATHAAIASDIDRFPKRYRTQVGERGITLSGGQKQRIGIARAILPRPTILLLDDALSSVDSHTEGRILVHLRKLMKGKICLISSHRIATLKDTDLILVLQEGRIVERGTHDDLLNNGGLYAEMHAMQMLEADLAAS
jgi:ATP-binding cassette subfamily B protein